MNVAEVSELKVDKGGVQEPLLRAGIPDVGVADSVSGCWTILEVTSTALEDQQERQKRGYPYLRSGRVSILSHTAAAPGIGTAVPGTGVPWNRTPGSGAPGTAFGWSSSSGCGIKQQEQLRR